MEKIKICNDIEDVKEYLTRHKDLYVCLYVADKTAEAWDISTSRVYMNKINNKFAYLPVNIKSGDVNTIRKIYELCKESKQIVAINQTQPHKSNPVIKEYFERSNILRNVDSLVKNKNDKLICYNLNGPAFTGWFEEEVTIFNKKTVVIFGVGGVGEPIAREIALKGVKKMYLIDINSKENLAEELSEYTDVSYLKKLNGIEFTTSEFIFINCAGKEGADDKDIEQIIKKFENKDNIFVDLRPQLDINIVNYAIKLGWNGYTGFGMNSRNDYALLEKIQETINIEIPTFDEFSKLVKSAS